MEDTSSELRMFLQGICCDYLLFRHLDEGVPPEAIRIRQEVALGAGVFADVEVRAGQAPPYFVEVDTGYSPERLLRSVRRKYGTPVPATDGAARVVVAADGDALGDRQAVERLLREALRPGLALEIWDEHHLLRLLSKPPGLCRDVVVVMADFCSYSSYVRDTRDEAVSRRSLTSFASRTRHRIVNDSGMLYQFLGDSVVGLFGVPEAPPRYLEQAAECARGLVDIGSSVAAEWQRQIDQIQPAAGVHVSMALGDLQVLSLRPLSRTHMGVIGDSINLATRLNTAAGCDEIVVSNTLYQRLPDTFREQFQELPPVEAKNIGRIRAWKLGPRRAPVEP